MRFSTYLIVCIIITTMLLFLMIATSFNIKKNHAKYLLFALTVAFFSSIGLTMSIGLTNQNDKIFWDTFKFVGVTFLPLALLLLYASVLKLNRLLAKKVIFLMCIMPTITIIIAFTNNMHGLFTARYEFMEFGGATFIFQTRAIWYYIHMAYSYTIIVLAFVMLVILHFKKPKIYRAQTSIIIFAATSGMVLSLMSTLRLFRDYGDASVLTYSVGICLQFWGLILYKPEKLLKIAKDLAFNNLQDPVLIFDNNNIYLDANKSAVNRFNINTNKITDVNDFISSKLNISFESIDNIDNTEICIAGNEPMYFSVDDRMLFDIERKYSGRVLVFNDITKNKSLANELEFTASRDVMTGLYNRRSFRERLKKLDKICPVSVISLIINNIKFYRNIMGNVYCEDITKAFADILSSVCQKEDYCARISDEEFVILLQSENSNASEKVAIIKERISQLSEYGLYFGISYGVSIKNYKNENIEIVYKTAGESMYNNQLINALASGEQAVQSLKKLLYTKTFETEEHMERTIAMCTYIAKAVGVTAGLENITKLAIVHDIGMTAETVTAGFPNAKEASASHTSHVIKGYGITYNLTELSMISGLIMAHHEKYDGTGYPKGLKGDEIPLFTRIVSLVDYYDKLAYGYRDIAPIGRENAIAQIQSLSGKYFDPVLVDLL